MLAKQHVRNARGMQRITPENPLVFFKDSFNFLQVNMFGIFHAFLANSSEGEHNCAVRHLVMS